MNRFLNYRIAFITSLFAAFGGILSTIMDIESVEPWSYAAIASLIALVTSLLISFLLKGRWTKKTKATVRRISIVLFVAFIFACFLFIWLFRFQFTFVMKEFDRAKNANSSSGITAYKMVRYIKGVYYTQTAQEYLQDPSVDKDPAEVVKAFGGSREINEVWDKRSRDLAQFYLMLSYSFFVLMFVANTSLLCELLATKYRDKPTREILASANA